MGAEGRRSAGATAILTGVEHPSDFEAGYALGKAVAAKVVSGRIDADRTPAIRTRLLRRRRLVPDPPEDEGFQT